MKFLQCEVCGNMVGQIKASGVPLTCCGKSMKTLVCGEIDAAQEKHVPVVKVDGNKVLVDVGSVAHPMADEHSIEWIALETKLGNQRKELKGEPKACFSLCEDDEVVAAYAYCNLHGLWKGTV